jgi:hypothetical protein
MTSCSATVAGRGGQYASGACAKQKEDSVERIARDMILECMAGVLNSLNQVRAVLL